MVGSPLSGGLLSGKYKRDLQGAKGRLNDFPFPPFNEERAYDILMFYIQWQSKKTFLCTQLAFWLMHQPVVSSVIIGATKLCINCKTI
jgi:aryl-alcohol dehydrogenase-like predicted oxidoreductase